MSGDRFALRSIVPPAALALLFLAISTVFNVLNPIWEGIDEPAHFQDVKYIAQTGRLPSKQLDLPTLFTPINCVNVHCVGTGSTTSQPQLYYAVVSPILRLVSLDTYVSWVPNPYFTWAGYDLRNGAAIHTLTERWPYHGMVLGVHLLRLLSGIMGAGTAVVAYFAGLALTQRKSFALAMGALMALTAGFVITSALIADDNLAILTSSVALLCGLKVLIAESRRWMWGALFVGFGVLALASKTDTVFLVPAAALLAVLVGWRQMKRGPLSRRVRGGLVAAGVSVLALASVSLAYAAHASDSGPLTRLRTMVTPIGFGGCHDCSLLDRLWGTPIPDLYDTFWGSFGWETFHLPFPFYAAIFVFCALSLVGLAGVAIGLLRRRTVVTNAPAWAFLIGSVAFTLVVVLFRAGATGSDGGTTHARFLFPDIIALIALLVAGLAALPRVLARAALGSFIAILSVTLGYAAWTVSGAFIWQPVYGDTISAGAQQPQAATFERGLELVGLNLPGGTIATGDQLHVRLFWSALRPIDFDYSAFLRLEDSAGHVIHDTDHVPGVQIGLLTHSWQVGEVVPDDWTIAIPADATAGQYRVQVGVYDYRNLQPLLDQTASPATTVATVTLS